MMASMKSYNHTLYASYLGYITQAIVNNFAPLLFLTFQRSYSIPLSQITLLVTFNFTVQLIVDLLSAKFADRIGYRILIVAAHIFVAVGLAGLALFPPLFTDSFFGLLLAVLFYAIGGGIIEVLVSPIVEACPSEHKSAAMSLLHSFYCWGHVFVVVASTIFFALAGIAHWRILACAWAVIPLLNAVYFSQVPIAHLTEDGEGLPVRRLATLPVFWVFVILMVCAGAAEQAMSQWASAFAESGLHVPKSIGDLAGPCLFAGAMGTSRILYSRMSKRIDLAAFMLGSCVLCIAGYLIASLSPNPGIALAGCAIIGFAVGIFWPGTFSVASKKCPKGGTAMFALLALAGDLGCGGGPTVVGFVSNAFSGNLKTGLLAAVVFPVLFAGTLWISERRSST